MFEIRYSFLNQWNNSDAKAFGAYSMLSLLRLLLINSYRGLANSCELNTTGDCCRISLFGDGHTSWASSKRLWLRRIQHYFISDNNHPANVHVDYADIGTNKVIAQVIKLASPVDGPTAMLSSPFQRIPCTLTTSVVLLQISIQLIYHSIE